MKKQNLELNQYRNDPWTVFIDSNGLLGQVFGIKGTYNLRDLSSNTYQIIINNYNPGNYGNAFSIGSTPNKILQYYPNKSLNLGNQNDISHNIQTNRTTFAGWFDLLSEINFQFNNYYITDPITNTTQYPLSNSSISKL